jgi:TrmH family RNA methyltransferase
VWVPHISLLRCGSHCSRRYTSTRGTTYTGFRMHFGAPITSKANARVKELRAAFSGKASAPGDLLSIEGEHLIAEALRSGYMFDTVFLREGSEAVLDRASLAGLQAQQISILSRDVYASGVETVSPQGIAATVLLRTLPTPTVSGTILVLEDIQDPGNLGTLLRSAEAFGAQQVMVTPGTVNQWNPKVVRASAGSVFRIPVLRAPLKQIDDTLAQAGVVLYAAVAPEAGSSSLLKTNFATNFALMVGNEGAGLSAEALTLAHHRIRIPCHVESLNAAVAGSTMLYEAMRQRESMV